MDTLHIPQLGRSVSRLGMGSMIFAPERKELVFDLLDAFRGLGGNLIDTAEVYGGEGRSEAAIAMYLAERDCRDEIVVLDKGCANVADVTPANIRKAIATNLQRLGIETLDIWAAHRDNPDLPVAHIVDTLNRERAEGRIRAFGGSNWSRQRIDEANQYAREHGLAGMCLSSPNLCLAVPNEPFWPDCTHATDADIAWSARTGIPLFAWSSQGRGFFLPGVSPGKRENADLARVYYNEANFARRERACQLAREKGVEPIHIALAWVLDLPCPTVALVGPATVAEVESCARAAEIRLSPEEVRWLRTGRRDGPWPEEG
ncbi:MAG: aldo/keto reductase [bacterium]